MRKLNKNNGITIISLIVTVIIMLILAGVTITMLKEDKIVDYAEKAAGDTQNAIDQEHALINKVGEYLKNKTSGEDSKLPERIKVGDYVNYTPTTGTYTVASGENGSGYTSEQSFTTETGENALEWRVWSIDEENGTVELISATQTSKKLYLKGADGYNHAVDILNDMCKVLYSNTNGATARSINVEDINAKTTYDYTTYTGTCAYGKQVRLSTYGTSYMKYPNLYSQEKGYGTANAFLQNLGESTGLNDGVTNENGITSYRTVKGYTDGNTEGTDPYVTYTYYYYTLESYLKGDQGVNTVPPGLINLGENYWLASRCGYLNSGIAYFIVRVVNSGGDVYGGLFNSNGDVYEGGYACRPVISLNSNVSLTVDESKTNGSVTYWDIEFIQ